MGYIKHNAIVVTGVMYDSHKLHKVYDKARELFGYNGVSDIVQSPLNSYISFFVAPDGSKEGWTDSDEGDSKRKQLADYIDSLAYGDGSTSVQFVDVSYDEEHEASVERTNKERPDDEDEEMEILKYECDECGEIYETTDRDLIYCSSDECVDKDIKLVRLHEL